MVCGYIHILILEHMQDGDMDHTTWNMLSHGIMTTEFENNFILFEVASRGMHVVKMILIFMHVWTNIQ